MFFSKFNDNTKLNNKGYSLIELIVVIAIMSIIVAVTTVSISLIFSKDAHEAAKKIDDLLIETRMLSISRTGNYALKIKKITTETGSSEYKAYIAPIDSTDSLLDLEGKVINEATAKDEMFYLTEKLGNKVVLYDGNNASSVTEITDFTVKFGSKGNAIAGITKDKGCYRIGVNAKRGNKSAFVRIVELTGKSLVEGE